jgi:hypothetical protein
MSGPNQLLSEIATPDIPREWAAIATNPLEPGLPEEERLKVLGEATLDAAEDARLHPRVVFNKEGIPHKAAEYDSVFSFQGELIDGPMTDVIVETDNGKMLFKRMINPEGETTFSLITTGGALGQIETNQPISTLVLPAEVLERSLIVPGKPVTLGNPRKGKLLQPGGVVTRITGLQLDEAGRLKMSDHMLRKAAEQVTDARDAFNDDIRYIRRNHVAPRTGSTATREVVTSPGAGWMPVSPAAKRAEQEQTRELAREKARQEREARERDELIHQGLSDLSYAITDRLISSEGVEGMAETDSRSGALKSVYKGELIPRSKDGELVDELSSKRLQVNLEVFDGEDTKTGYWVSDLHKMSMAWTSTVKPEGGLVISNIQFLDGKPAEKIKKYFDRVRNALLEDKLEDTGGTDEEL